MQGDGALIFGVFCEDLIRNRCVLRTLHNEETLGALATRTLGFLSVQRGRKSKPRNEDFILCQVPGSEGVGWGAEGKRGEGARSKMLAPRELEVHWTEVVIGLP